MPLKLRLPVVLLFAVAGLFAQAASKNLVGTVSAVRPEASEIESKSEAGVVTVTKIAPETSLKSVAPGETSLSKAVDATVDAIHVGDRVLITMQGDLVRRVIVMQAKSIEQWKEADKAEWQKRGVAGVVKEKKGNELTLKGPGEAVYVITLKPAASFKRYPAESVKFADAKLSKLEEVQVGDQLRARGEKSPDGLKVTADEVVFGTFVTRAGVIQSINAETGEITAKDIGGKETLIVHVTVDSQIKKFGAGGMGGGGGGMGGPGGPGGMTRPPGGDGAGARAGGQPGSGGPPTGGQGGPGGAGAGGPAGGRRFDVSQIVERLPAGTKTDLKVGETIVFSSSVALSSQGAKKNDLTAIMLISNAERLLAMAAPPRPAQQRDMAFGAGGGGGGGGMGLGGLELPIFQ